VTKTALPSAGRDEVAGERTFLIADVRGYTRFTHLRGDAAAARLAGRFALLARDAVEARGGRVIELRGDEALAVFVSAAAAVRAATDLVAVCAEEAAGDPDLPLTIGVGIDMGEAVPVEGGFRGAALNTAARLCSKADGGQVLVTPRVAAETSDAPWLQYLSRGMAELKGFDAPVELLEATIADTRPPPSDTLDEPPPKEWTLPLELEAETPFVGRERELSWLRGIWRQARRGYGRVVFLSGPPQSGKTRLAAELAASAHAPATSISYVGAGGTATALAISALSVASSARRPTLLILDDLEALGDSVIGRIAELHDAFEGAPVLVLLIVRDVHAVPALATIAARHDGPGDADRNLGALDAIEIRELARLYAGADVDDAPLEAIGRASGGMPGRVHELMSEWADQEVSRRLAAAAEWLAAERTNRKANLEFANNVIGLKLARLYAAEDEKHDDGPPICPYKGLASFDEADARFFFGRERLVGELAARTVATGLLAVVGASGSGKSSLIAAGLAPSLAAGLLPGSERWHVTVMRPGEHPLAKLQSVEATDDDRRRHLLVVDQFEEIFTTCVDEQERAAFVDALIERARCDHEASAVVLSLRGDFIDHCATYPALAELISANQVLVGPMTQEELRRAIEGPARRVGLRVETALVETLVAEVADEPGGLPLLSTALVELWQQRSGGWLRKETYQETGGVRSAVTRLAENSYEHLTHEQREAARRLFLRLVASGDEGAVARRRVPLSELDLERDAVLAAVVERLTADRLLTAQESNVEVAHEALLREWPRFQDWLREDAQGRELREHLTQSAKRWEGAGRDAAELYRGARLTATLDWAAAREQELNELERGFLAESRRHAEFEAERQRRQNRRLRAALAGAAVLLAAAIAGGIVALVLRSNAQRSATSAVAQRLGAQALVQNDLDLSLLLAREGVNLSDSPATRSNLLAALLRSPRAIGIMRPLPGRLLQISSSRAGTIFVGNNASMFAVIDPINRHVNRFSAGVAQLSADGSRVALLDGDGSVRFAAVGRGAPARASGRFNGHGLSVANASSNPSFSPDLKLLAGAVAAPGKPPALVVFQTSPVRFVADLPLPAHTQPYRWQAFSPDSRYLLAGGNGLLSVWRVGRYRAPVLTLHVPASIAQLSNDDRLLAFGGADGALHLYDFPAGMPRPLNGRHNGFVTGVGFSPDDRTLVTTSDDSQVLVWDVATGDLRATLTGHRSRAYGPAFSPDGRTVYTGGFDGSVIAWDLAGTRSLGRIYNAGPGNDPHVAQLLTASPNGRLLAFTEINGSVVIRDARSFRTSRTLNTGRGAPNALAFSPDSRLLATETHLGGPSPDCKGPRIELWDVRTGAMLGRLPIPGPAIAGASNSGQFGPGGLCVDVEALAFSPNGKLLAGGFDTGQAFLWNVQSRRLETSFRAGPSTLGVAFSPDGRMLAVAEGAETAVWNLADRRKLYTVNVDDGYGASKALAFSPDGRSLATGGGNGIVKLWDAYSGRFLRRSTITIQCQLNLLQFSPDGRSLLASACDGAARLFDVASLGEIGAPFQGPVNVERSDAVYSLGGRRVVVAYQTGEAYVWDVAPADWKQHACAVAGRNLTRDEWRFFLPGRSYHPVCPGLPAQHL